jgi:anti-sigma B factor antagonist
MASWLVAYRIAARAGEIIDELKNTADQPEVQMPDVSYTAGIIGGTLVVTAPEEIDVTSAPALRAELLAVAERGHTVFAVDMTRTQFCDSVGLGALIRAHQRAQAAGGGVRLVVQAPAIRRILAVTGADQIIPCYSNLEDALAEPPANQLPPRPSQAAPSDDPPGAGQTPYPRQHAGLQACCDG